MDKLYRCPDCGSEEFITPLNAYDIYQIVGGEPTFIRTNLAEDEFMLHCRECGRRVELDRKLDAL